MQTILNSNKTTKESEIIMNQIVFSAGFVQANIFCSLLCILLPILFVWYQKRKNGSKTRGIFYWSCVLPALFLRCHHNCECFDFFNSGAFILFQCKKSSGLLGTVRSLLPWYSFDYRSIYRIEVCNEKTSGQGKCADFRSWYGRF